MQARKFVLKSYFEGLPKESDFEIVEETVSEELQEGEFLIKAVCHSVDPYMRAWANKMSLRDTMQGSQVAEVLKSKNSRFPVGSKVVAYTGWRDVTKITEKLISAMMITLLPDMKGLGVSNALGVLGMPGMTAYFGFLEICQPKEGENVVVSVAAGAVGSIVAQIAKLKGLRVIAFAGTEEKVNWLKNDLGIKFAFNYKEVHLDSILKKYAVEGVDCYFDNVGGEFSCTVMSNMNDRGRIAVCGAISVYNEDTKDKVKIPFDYGIMIYKQIKMEGFVITRWKDQFPEGIKQVAQWMQEGKIKFRETKTQGFENMPKAFIEMLQGKNIGKAIVMA